MKTIGLLGGMSWESSALYYRLLNEAVREELGGLHSARCVLLSVDFDGIARLQESGDWERAGELLAADARSLQAAGAEIVLLCTNTMHQVADALTAVLEVPLLHIGDVTAVAVRAQGSPAWACSARPSRWSGLSCASGWPGTGSTSPSPRPRTGRWCTA